MTAMFGTAGRFRLTYCEGGTVRSTDFGKASAHLRQGKSIDAEARMHEPVPKVGR